jgi:hypothetical protein
MFADYTNLDQNTLQELMFAEATSRKTFETMAEKKEEVEEYMLRIYPNFDSRVLLNLSFRLGPCSFCSHTPWTFVEEVELLIDLVKKGQKPVASFVRSGRHHRDFSYVLNNVGNELSLYYGMNRDNDHVLMLTLGQFNSETLFQLSQENIPSLQIGALYGYNNSVILSRPKI